jgi:hypothetical protein
MHTSIEDLNDIRGSESSHRASFTLEPLGKRRTTSPVLRRELDGNGCVEMGVSSLPHLTHASFADTTDELVSVRYDLIRGERRQQDR